MTDDKMLARIAALLRQAEGTDNAHEAEAFMTAAQRLATATSIDLAVARSHSAKREAAQTPTQRTITIGEAGSRGLRTYVQLFSVIAHANDVRCDVASNSTFVYAYGFAEDIDATHALYASLVVQMVRACDAYLSTGEHRPTPTITARLNFQLAFGARVGHRGSGSRSAKADFSPSVGWPRSAAPRRSPSPWRWPVGPAAPTLVLGLGPRLSRGGPARRTRALLALAGAVVVLVAGFAVPLPTDGPRAPFLAVQGNVPEPGLDFNAERRQVLDNHVAATEARGRRRRRSRARARPRRLARERLRHRPHPQRRRQGRHHPRAVDALGAPLVVGGLLEEPAPDYRLNVALLFEPGKGNTEPLRQAAPGAVRRVHPEPALLPPLQRQGRPRPRGLRRGHRPGVFRVHGGRARDRAGRRSASRWPTTTSSATPSTGRQRAGGPDQQRDVRLHRRVGPAAGHQPAARHGARPLGRPRRPPSARALITPDGTAHQPTTLFTRTVLSGAHRPRGRHDTGDRVGALPGVGWPLLARGRLAGRASAAAPAPPTVPPGPSRTTDEDDA